MQVSFILYWPVNLGINQTYDCIASWSTHSLKEAGWKKLERLPQQKLTWKLDLLFFFLKKAKTLIIQLTSFKEYLGGRF